MNSLMWLSVWVIIFSVLEFLAIVALHSILGFNKLIYLLPIIFFIINPLFIIFSLKRLQKKKRIAGAFILFCPLLLIFCIWMFNLPT